MLKTLIASQHTNDNVSLRYPGRNKRTGILWMNYITGTVIREEFEFTSAHMTSPVSNFVDVSL